MNKFAIGALVGIGAMTVAVACGAGGLSPLARCKLAAIDAVLPDDVRQISIGDAIDIWQRVHDCKAAVDGGAP